MPNPHPENAKTASVEFPENVKKIAVEFMEILEKYYPGLTKKNLDSFGFPNFEGSSAQERIEMCLYIELMKAGAFNAII